MSKKKKMTVCGFLTNDCVSWLVAVLRKLAKDEKLGGKGEIAMVGGEKEEGAWSVFIRIRKDGVSSGV